MPLRRLEDQHRVARSRVDQLRKAISEISYTPNRLTRAEAERKRVSQVTSKAALHPHCGRSCRANNAEQLQRAQAEVDAARAEVAERRERLQSELRTAEANLADLPLASISSPLAKWFGLPAHYLDLSYAGGMSIALLFLGTAILHWGGSRRPISFSGMTSARREDPDIGASSFTVVSTHKVRSRSPSQEANRFCASVLEPDESGEVRLKELFHQYQSWCRRLDFTPLPERKIGEEISILFQKVGLDIVDRGNGLVAVGVSLRNLQATDFKDCDGKRQMDLSNA